LTLEELDNVFGVSNREHASYYWRKLPWYLKKYILHKDVAPFPPLYEFAANDGHYPHEKPDTSHIEGNNAVGGTQDKELFPGPR
jgi:hypothetical protein